MQQVGVAHQPDQDVVQVVGDAPAPVFMFPGGGAQYAGMARDLYDTEPAFRDWMDRGLAALALVYGLAQQNGVPSVYGLLLSGAIINALCSSLLMLIISTINVEGLHSITWWMLGNLQGPSKPLLKAGWAINALGMIGLWLMAREFNALTLGRDMAHHLGVRTGRVVLLGMALSALLAAVGVAMAGLIGFVGLIVPHQVRNWVGPDLRRLIPLSALAGGMFLVICDTLARVVFAPVEIPVGVITALLGGPFFLVLLRRRRKSGWLE